MSHKGTWTASRTAFNEAEKTIERPGCNVHYGLFGDPGKPLIFFAHGACVDHRQFDLQMPCLAEDYQIVRLDVRGHGASRPLSGPFSVPDVAEDMVAILKALGRTDAIFIGQSAGTYATQELAFRHPEMARAMVLIDGTCITAKLTAMESFLLRMGPYFFYPYPYKNIVKDMVDASSIKEDTKAYLTEATSRLSKKEIIAIMTGLSGCIHYEPEYHVQCPLLLVRGDHDRLGNIEKAMPEWSRRDSQSQYVVIPDAGHCSNQDNPGFFNGLMVKFLKEHVK